MQVCLRLCGWILIQQDEIQIWLSIELKIDHHCSEGRYLDVKKMSANSRITNRCGRVYFAFSRWLNSFLIGFVADSFRDMLADSVLQTLRSSAYVPVLSAYPQQNLSRKK